MAECHQNGDSSEMKNSRVTLRVTYLSRCDAERYVVTCMFLCDYVHVRICACVYAVMCGCIPVSPCALCCEYLCSFRCHSLAAQE